MLSTCWHKKPRLNLGLSALRFEAGLDLLGAAAKLAPSQPQAFEGLLVKDADMAVAKSMQPATAESHWSEITAVIISVSRPFRLSPLQQN